MFFAIIEFRQKKVNIWRHRVPRALKNRPITSSDRNQHQSVSRILFKNYSWFFLDLDITSFFIKQFINFRKFQKNWFLRTFVTKHFYKINQQIEHVIILLYCPQHQFYKSHKLHFVNVRVSRQIYNAIYIVLVILFCNIVIGKKSWNLKDL